MNALVKLIIAIWDDDWRDRMFFIISMLLIAFANAPYFQMFNAIDRGYMFLSLIAGCGLLYFVLKDWFNSYRKIKNKEKQNQELNNLISNAIKIRDEIKEEIKNNKYYFKSNGGLWEIQMYQTGELYLSRTAICPQKDCGDYINYQQGLGQCCQTHETKVSDLAEGSFFNISKNEFDIKIDLAKKRLGVEYEPNKIRI